MKTYEKYKPSGIDWIGEIPEHWEAKKTKFSFNYTTGFTPPTGNVDFYDGDIVWITIGDMNKEKVAESSTKLSTLAIKTYKPQITVKGSLLFSFKLSVGKVAFAGTDVYTNEAIISIPPSETYDLRFLYYIVGNQLLQNANENIYGAKILNQELIKNAFIILPKAYEQTAIADYLDEKTAEIDKLIANKKRLIKLLKEERTAIINQAVTKGINADAKLKPSSIDWLGNIPEHWEVKKLKYLVSKVGSGVTPSGGANVYQEEGIPLLRSQNIYFDGLRLDDVAYISEEIDESMNNSRIKENDVLLNITGASIGRCFYIPKNFGKGNVNQHVCIIRPIKDVVETRYLHAVLSSGYGQNLIDLCQTGANREGLNFQQIKSFDIPFCEIKEQKEIVEFIESKTNEIDSTISKIEKEIELIKEYRTALISEVVTGKIKIT